MTLYTFADKGGQQIPANQLDSNFATLLAQTEAASSLIASHVANMDNPHNTTAAQVGAQPASAILSSLAGLTASADKLAYFTGASSLALADLAAYSRGLLADADAVTWRGDLDVYSTAEVDTAVQGQASNYADDTGAANAYAATFNPAISAHMVGMPLRVKIANTCTGASTFDPGPSAKPIVNQDGSAVSSGQIVAGGIYTFIYDGANYQFFLSQRLSNSLPQPLGTASAGTSALAARSDHIHPKQLDVIDVASFGVWTPGVDCSATLQAAIDSASDGACIALPTTIGAVLVKGVELSGTAKNLNNITLTSFGAAYLALPNSYRENILNVTSGTGHVISNITFDGQRGIQTTIPNPRTDPDYHGWNGIYLPGADNCTVEGCTFKNFATNAVVPGNADHTGNNNCIGNKVINNIFYNNSSDVGGMNQTNCTISGNKSYWPDSYFCIVDQYSNGTNVTGNTVQGGYQRVAVTSLTHSGTTATITFAHPLPVQVNDVLYVTGATGADASIYNGKHTVLTQVADGLSYTFTLGSTPSGDATGTITAIKVTPKFFDVTSITHSGNVATVTISQAENIFSGTYIYIYGATGADASLYNGVFQVSAVTTPNAPSTFTYTMAGTPGANATGTIYAIQATDAAILLYDCNQCNADNNVALSTNTTVTALGGTSDCNISNNIGINSNNTTVSVAQFCQRLSITGTKSVGPLYYGVQLNGAIRCNVSKSIIYDAGYSCIALLPDPVYFKSSQNIISDNICLKAGGAPIYLLNADLNTIAGNITLNGGSGYGGIELAGSGGCLVEGNTSYDDGRGTQSYGIRNTLALAAASVNAGGSGYVNGDIVTLAGGTADVAAQIKITNAVAGVVQAGGFAIYTGGSYTATSTTFTQASTSGSGTGLTLNSASFTNGDNVITGNNFGGNITAPASLTGVNQLTNNRGIVAQTVQDVAFGATDTVKTINHGLFGITNYFNMFVAFEWVGTNPTTNPSISWQNATSTTVDIVLSAAPGVAITLRTSCSRTQPY